MIMDFINETIKFYNEMAIYLVFGFIVAGILHVFFPDTFITRHMGKNNWKSVIKSSIFGIPLPLCSCGVIPVAASLKKKGASNGSTLSFLISTPQIGADSFMITYSLIGWVFAVFRIIAAFVTAIIAGIAANFAVKNNEDIKIESNKTNTGIKQRLKSIFSYIQFELLGSIAGYLVIGILAAGAIAAFVPADLFSKYLGSQFLSMILMLVIGIPMYVCATASTPIAASLIMKGLSPGAALVFLLAGPATNALTISTVVKTMGKKIAVIYVGSIAAVSLLLGYIINFMFYDKQIKVVHPHAHETLPGWLLTAGTITLTAMLAFYFIHRHVYLRIKKKKQSSISGIITMKVEGMTCSHCASTVKRAVESVPGINNVEVDLNGKTVSFKGDSGENSKITKAIEEKGFSVRDE